MVSQGYDSRRRFFFFKEAPYLLLCARHLGIAAHGSLPWTWWLWELRGIAALEVLHEENPPHHSESHLIFFTAVLWQLELFRRSAVAECAPSDWLCGPPRELPGWE